MIVIDDFPAFYHAERRAYRLIGPPDGLGYPDGNGVAAVVASESISLRRGNAEFPVLHEIDGFIRSLAFGDIIPATT